MRKIIKNLGRFFVRSKIQDGKILEFSVVLIDSVICPFGHIVRAIEDVKKSFGNAKITVITSAKRLQYLNDCAQDLEIIVANRMFVPKRLRISFELALLCRREPDFIILLNYEMLPILISLIFLRKRLYIFNEHRKWGVIRRKTLDEYLVFIPRLIFNIFLFIYLLIATLFIFLNKPLYIRKRENIKY